MSFIRRIIDSAEQKYKEIKEKKEINKADKPGVKGTEPKVDKNVDKLSTRIFRGLNEGARGVKANFKATFTPAKKVEKTDVEKREYLLGALDDLIGTMLTKMQEQEAANANLPEGLFRLPINNDEKDKYKTILNDYNSIGIDKILEKFNNGQTQKISNPNIKREVEIEALGGYLKAFVENFDKDLFSSPEDKAKLQHSLAQLEGVYSMILDHPETRFIKREHLYTAIPSIIELQKFAIHK